MNKLLCPSTMCIDFLNLAEDVKALDDAGVDIFHNDIMDGTFVPNITLGINDVKAIRNCTKKPVDVHLMIENPGTKVDWFIDAGADIVYIHPESERYVVKTLARIKERGAAGIAELSALGADGFVLGTSALFGKGRPYADIVPELRAL